MELSLPKSRLRRSRDARRSSSSGRTKVNLFAPLTGGFFGIGGVSNPHITSFLTLHFLLKFVFLTLPTKKPMHGTP